MLKNPMFQYYLVKSWEFLVDFLSYFAAYRKIV